MQGYPKCKWVMHNTIYTIGHSTRTIEQFIELLMAHSIEELVDVRTIPKSRHNPQFAEEELAASLQEAGIAYKHLAKLGGLNNPLHESQAQFISLCCIDISVDLEVWLLCRAETYLLACNPFINKLGAKPTTAAAIK